jgi:hypothetical protein
LVGRPRGISDNIDLREPIEAASLLTAIRKAFMIVVAAKSDTRPEARSRWLILTR